MYTNEYLVMQFRPLITCTFSGQFHQHFMLAFFVQKCFVQLSLVTFHRCNFWHQNIRAKWARKMLIKLTPDVKMNARLRMTFFTSIRIDKDFEGIFLFEVNMLYL
jgi:hypothetical protein